jgi:hypothetical protein
MAEFKLGRIRFIWKNIWTTGTTYVKDDIVRNGGKTYLCVSGHVANASFNVDLANIPARWNQVSDGSEWKSDWDVATYYKINDLVKYGGRLYLCNAAHTSNADASSGTSPETTAGLEADQTKWDLYATSFDFKDNWTTATFYKINDVVRHGGISYVCNTSHTSSATSATDIDGLEEDFEKWDVYAKGFDWVGDWTTTYRYKRNDVVRYGGTTYVCNTGHASASTSTLGLEADQSLWDYFHKGLVYLGTWSPSSVRYKVNDLVKYGSNLWICTDDHTSVSLFEEASWSLFVGGLEFENSWSSSEVYQPGDVVSYGGYAYVATTNNTNKLPTANLSDWDLFTTGFSFQGDWADATDYKVGQVLRLNGYTYIAILDHTSDALTNVPPNATNWSRLNSGIKWAATDQTFTGVTGTNIIGTGISATFDVTNTKTTYSVALNLAGTGYAVNDTIKILGSSAGGTTPANDLLITVATITGGGGTGPIGTITSSGFSVSWKLNVDYVLGDAVTMGVNSYICILAHTADSFNRPDVDTTGAYWNLLASGAITSVLTTQGDTIYMGGAGPTRLPIGTDGQVLRVNGNVPSWSYFGVINNVVYVALNGTDVNGAGQGLTWDKPWRTVQYAARQIEDGYQYPNASTLLSKNKQFLLKEIQNFVAYTYTVSVASASTTVFTATDTSNIYVGMPISFTSTTGGVVAGTTYYVFDIPNDTTFGITDTSGGVTRRTLVAGSGAMTGSYVFSASKTERDAGYIIDSYIFDLTHSGTLHTTTSALAYFTSAGTSFIPGVYAYDIIPFVGALNYLKTLTSSVLNNTAPSINYQALNGISVGDRAIQDIDLTLTSEAGTATIVTNLVSLVTTGLSAGNTSAIPAVINPGTTISVKTGTYSEILPIVVPKNTAVVGDELRSSVVQPATANLDLVNDSAKTISVLTRIKSLIPDIVTNVSVTPTSGNTQTQVTTLPDGDLGSPAAISSVLTSVGTMTNILENTLTAVPDFTFTDPTGYNVGYLTGYGDGKAQIVQNYDFIKDEVASYLAIFPEVGFWDSLGLVGQTACLRDIGYILDSLQYDMTYGGNTQTLITGSAYYSNATLTIGSNEKAATLLAYTHLKSFIDNIVIANTAGWTKSTLLTQTVSGTAGSAGAATFAQARIQEIIDWITNGVTPATILPTASIALADVELQNGYNALQLTKTEIQTDTVAWVQKFYPTMNFNSSTCFRDAGYIIDALAYDLVFGTNFNSIKAAMAYFRETSSAQVVVTDQLPAEIGSINFIGQKAKRIVANGAAAQLVTTIDDMILSIAGTYSGTASETVTGGNITVSNTDGLLPGMPIVFAGSLGNVSVKQPYWIISIIDSVTITITAEYGSTTPLTVGNISGSATWTAGGGFETTGTGAYNNVLTTIQGLEVLRANKTFLAYESTAWVAENFGGTVTTTTASTDELTTSSAHNLTAGDPVVFSETTIGGIIAGTIYYVLDVPSSVTFRLTSNQGSIAVFEINDGSGSMAVRYNFSEAMYRKSVNAYIDGLIYDTSYLGNYKSLRAMELYRNEINGSQLSNMFLLRNGTGLRNMTLTGLNGTLGPANIYGTQRPTAGAYSSLDPGYGPTDRDVWITPRSPYTQNVTLFGTGCIGMKIDSSLHAGGNKSIVANDYTTIINDGIGVWCIGSNALTELVSVFAYFSYAGYLAENGGKIRATNGNNSYGTYGSLAEGVDVYETPITATIDNRYYQAQITNVVSDGTDNIYRMEYANAGTNYTTATYSIGGTGYNAEVVANEFRDGAVFETRLITNGADYAATTNVAQGGSTTSITLAATDSAISAAYIGMRIIVSAGSGKGQTGYFTTYNSGTKGGIIAKESIDALTVSAAGSSLLTVSNTTSLYANMPVILTGALLTGMSTIALNTIYYVVGASITATQFSVSASPSGAALAVGSGASGGPLVLHAVGWDHIITGTPIASALDLTSAYILEPRVKFTSPAYAAIGATIADFTWKDIVYGETNNTYTGSGGLGVVATGGSGSGAKFDVTRTGTYYTVDVSAPGTGYKLSDVLTIAGSDLGGSSNLNDITLVINNVTGLGAINNYTFSGVGSGGYFVVLPITGTATQVASNGANFSSGGSLTASLAWSAMAYGAGRWVAVATGTDVTNLTTDPSLNWSAGGTLPASADWTSICYGNGVFMAVASGGTNAAYSVNGTGWFSTSALPASTTWTGVAYGNGVYVAVASGGTQAAISTDGLSWVTKALPTAANWSSVTFGKGLFVAVATGSRNTAYSKDGLTWVLSNPGMPVSQSWTKVRYGQGLFFATASGLTNIAATSENGVTWTSRTLTISNSWDGIAFGNPNTTPTWIALGSSSPAVANTFNVGCTAQARVKISNGSISEVRMVEPGSGYSSPPTMTIIDPNYTLSASWSVRVGKGALANPTFTNRGLQYATATSTVFGNGYADQYQTGFYLNVAGLPSNPTAGSNIQLALNSNYYKLVQVTNFLGTGGGQSPYTARFQMSPAIEATNTPDHGTGLVLRLRYSQVRLTGHDFLSIGTGGTTTTNYPNTPLQPSDETKQTVGNGGGRVFYTATDQDGNFTVGTLFSVQQATGVASINADAFNLAGLNSLTLGSVALGGSGATITSFSTDQYFTANSDNIVPTQKAIKSFISSQIGGGSSALNVNTLTAGVIYIAGNSISTTTGVQINVTATMNFTGGINGLPVAMDFLLLG